MCAYMYVWLGVSWNVSPLRYRKLATVLHHNNISASCICACTRASVCVCDRFWASVLKHLSLSSHLNQIWWESQTFNESHANWHTNISQHGVIKIIKKNKQQAQCVSVCVRACVSADSVRERVCNSAFTTQTISLLHSLAFSILSLPLSLGHRLLATRHFRPKNKPLEMKRTRNKT